MVRIKAKTKRVKVGVFNTTKFKKFNIGKVRVGAENGSNIISSGNSTRGNSSAVRSRFSVTSDVVKEYQKRANSSSGPFKMAMKRRANSLVEKYIKRAASAALLLSQTRIMVKALELYYAYGLDKHELTGNTRASIMSATYTNTHSGLGKNDIIMGMPNTPPPTHKVLDPGGFRTPSITAESSGNTWRYYVIKQYRTGKWRRFPVDYVQETHIAGYADRESRLRLYQMRKDIKVKDWTTYGIGIVAMNPTYVPEIVTLMFNLQKFAEDTVYESLKAILLSGKTSGLKKVIVEEIMTSIQKTAKWHQSAWGDSIWT